MFTFIDSIEDLHFLNQELLTKDFVGVDTEFRRTHKDNMKLALLQVNDGEEIFLIDALLIKSPKRSRSFLFSKSVTKIFHSCKEDLEAVFSWTDQKMTNIFDTQLANSLLGKNYSIGYQGLVEQELDIILEKNETRSNWLRRPLSDAQMKYAALDVEYLPHLYNLQIGELRSSNKLKWHDEEIQRLIRLTFSFDITVTNPIRTISRAQEDNLLSRLNQIVNRIAEEEEINPTLFFSKKAQKDFLRLVLHEGLESASSNITSWRKELILEDIISLLR